MNLTQKILYNGIATIVATVSGLLRNKIFALFLSLNLFGILSLGQQSASLLFTIFALGIPLGITTFSSQLVSLPEQEQKIRISQMMVLTLVAGGALLALMAVLLSVFPVEISRLVTGSDLYALPLSIMLFAVPFTLVHSCFYAMMEGMGRVKEIVLFRIAPSLAALPIIYVLSLQYKFTGAATGVLFQEILLVIVAVILFRKQIVFSKHALRFQDVFSQIFAISVLSFIAGVSWLLIDFFVKRFVLELSGEGSNGIVQSVAKVTDLYPNLALAWLAMHLFPLLGEKKEDTTFVAATVERTMSVAMTIIIPIIIVLFAFRGLILEIIYKEEFVQASLYFGAMLITGIPKVFTWVIGIALLPIGMKRVWFYSTMIYTLLYAGVAIIGVSTELSFYAIPLALVISLTVQSGYVLGEFKKRGIMFSKQFYEQLMLFCIVMALFSVSLFYEYIQFAVIPFFVFFLARYNLLKEIKEKITAVVLGSSNEQKSNSK